jgi:hypothetical protein
MPAMATSVPQQKSGLTLWKASRWIILGGMAVTLFLLLKKPPAVADAIAPEAARQRSDEFQTKLAGLEQAHQRGETAEARFSSEEINAAFQRGPNEPAAASGATQPTPAGGSEQNPAIPGQAPEISTTQVAFAGDHATGQFVVRGPGGKDIYLTISGKIKAVNGYASFEFTDGKIGDMPVPISLFNARLQEKLQEPETRPKLKLPDFVADIRVENGQLVMVEK